jgi:hypothetical protein
VDYFSRTMTDHFIEMTYERYRSGLEPEAFAHVGAFSAMSRSSVWAILELAPQHVIGGNPRKVRFDVYPSFD